MTAGEMYQNPADYSNPVIGTTAVTSWISGSWSWIGTNHHEIAALVCIITGVVCVATFVRNILKDRRKRKKNV